MLFRRFLPFLLLIFCCGILPACKTAKKRNSEADQELMLGALRPNEDVSEETLAKLKEIAEDPSSNLEFPEEDFLDPQQPIHGTDLGFPEEKAFDPAIAWKKPGLDPRAISPGDIFSENDGPILNKSFSLADSLSEEERKQLFEVFTSSGTMRVPMTISPAELADLRNQAAAGGREVDLPTRSVALDFRARTFSSDSAKLENLYEELLSGAPSGELASLRLPAGSDQSLSKIKKRLKGGEKLYVITGVTESSHVTASYPGAPVGRRDAEPIQNAVQQMFPHLDRLEANKQDRTIVLTGKPRVLWEFEARELKLEGDKLVVDTNALVQL